MSASEPKLVCVTGPDGAGKTTQIARIAEAINKRTQDRVSAVTIWDVMLDPSTKGRTGFKSPAEVDAYLQTLVPVARAMFLFHCFFQAVELGRRRKSDVLLLNAYWYKYYATEVAHGGDAAQLRKLTEVFPEPLLTFYLKISPREAFRRKTALSGYESGYAHPRTEESFVAFQAKAHEVLEALAAEKGWVELNGKESRESLSELLISRIEGA